MWQKWLVLLFLLFVCLIYKQKEILLIYINIMTENHSTGDQTLSDVERSWTRIKESYVKDHKESGLLEDKENDAYEGEYEHLEDTKKSSKMIKTSKLSKNYVERLINSILRIRIISEREIKRTLRNIYHVLNIIQTLIFIKRIQFLFKNKATKVQMKLTSRRCWKMNWLVKLWN